MPNTTSIYSAELNWTPNQIKRLFGINQRSLRTMRSNPKANNGDVPQWFPVNNRPHYPAALFDQWLQRQRKNGNIGDVAAVRAVPNNRTKTAD